MSNAKQYAERDYSAIADAIPLPDDIKGRFQSELYWRGIYAMRDALSPALPDAPKTCSWWDDGSGIWESACGVMYQFTSDGPFENGHKFCNKCGLLIDESQTDAGVVDE